jgi:hypothetical protein
MVDLSGRNYADHWLFYRKQRIQAAILAQKNEKKGVSLEMLCSILFFRTIISRMLIPNHLYFHALQNFFVGIAGVVDKSDD